MKPAAKLDRTQHRAVVAAGLLMVTGTIPAVLTGGLGVQIRDDLGLSTSQFGLTFSLSAITIGLVSLVAGATLDRLGWRRSLTIAATFAGIGLIGLAASGSWGVLTVWILVGGVAMAFALPASNVMLAREVPPERLGMTMGVKQTAGSWSALYAGFAVAVLAAPLGWRWVMVTGLAFPVLAVLTAPKSGISDQPAESLGEALPKYTVHGRRWRLRFLAVGAVGMITSQAIMAFFVITLVEAGVTEATAGIALAVGSAASIAVQVLTGSHADKRHQDGLRSVAVLFVVATLGLALLAVRQPALALLGAVLAFGAGRGWQGQFFYAVVRVSARTPGAATGLAVTGMAAGAALGPVIFGMAADQAGHSTGWAVLAGLTAVGAVLALSGADTVAGRRRPGVGPSSRRDRRST